MANSLKFGGGQWATKEGSALAYNDENGNFKPLPFDFTRASKATVINKNGLIEEVASGQPRIDYLGNTKGSLLLEPSRTNLITQSEAFANYYWTKSGASIEGDPSTAGSELILSTMVNSVSFAYDTFDSATSSGFHARNDSAGSSQRGGTVDEISFVIGKTYRINIDVSVASGSIPFLRARDAIGTNPTILSEQLVNGSNILYVTSDSTFTGILEFSNGSVSEYTVSNVSVKEVSGFASPSADSPLGAFKLVEGTNTGNHNIFSANLAVTLGLTYTFSLYVKKGERNKVRLDGGYRLSLDATFDLDNLSVSGNGTIESFANGWYKLSATGIGEISTGNTNLYAYILNDLGTQSYTGDGASGVYLYGAQLEQGSYATSYIKTQGTAQTRLADSCSQTVPDGVIGQTEGVAYVEIDWKENDEESIFSVLHDGTVNNRMDFGYSATFNSFYFNVRTSGSGQGLMQYSSPISGKYKIAIAYENNGFALWINGVKEASDSSGSVPITTKYNVGNYIGGGREYPIISSKLYDTKLTDQELSALTQV